MALSRPIEHADGTRRGRLVGARDAALFALVTFVPLLLGARGRLNADTKQYLYLDPVGLMDRARTLWDPSVGGGTVTHQTIGYLWPMGPYYWFTDLIGLPDWVAQRIWIGGIQLTAALGALALLRTLLDRHPAQLVGAALYGLSPFVLGHVTGQSALLLPFAAFPWLVLCVLRATSERGWRWPALFALIVTTCGSLNGSSVFFVLLGAVLWVPYAVWFARTTDVRGGIAVVLRLGALTLLTQLWWLAAYSVGGRYGLPILSVTENVQTTSNTTSAAEILRGLGYWFFYGRDPHAPWLDNIAPTYLEAPVGIVVSFAVPVVALALGALVRCGARVYFTTLVLVGVVIAVGAFPEPRSPLGAAFEAASRRSDLVLSLRNTQRAAPLVVLGLAGLAAAGATALQRRHARIGALSLVVLAVAIAGALPAQWRTGLIAERFHRDDIPDAWTEVGQHLDAGEGRVLEIPGIDFASYRWGHTLDPVSVGLTERSVLARELVPMGGSPGVSLLAALDRSMQEGTFEPASLAVVARLLGASDVLVRNDLEYERYRTVRPARLWPMLVDDETGLDPPVTFGPRVPNRAVPDRPMIDEIELALDPNAEPPPQLAVFPVPGGGRQALSALPIDGGVVIEGDGEGVVAAAAAGLLDDLRGPLLFASDATDTDARFAASTGDTTRYVITDSNRKRAERWYSLRENGGATEPADGGVVIDDPSDARLEVTPDLGIESRTVVEWRGVDRVWATAYGSPYTLAPEERPSNAFDGDVRTAWLIDTEGFSDLAHKLGVQLSEPSTAPQLTLVPPQGRPGARAVVRAQVVLDGVRRFDIEVTEEQARDPAGIIVALDGQPFTRVEVEIIDVLPDNGPAGFAEVLIPGVRVDEVVVLPTDLFDTLGERAGDVPLAVVLTRLRSDPAEIVRGDPEPSIVRAFTVHAPVTMALRGTARLHVNAPDDAVDAALGLPGADAGGWTARSTEHLAGSARARASSAFDGDPSTAWTTPLVGLRQTIELDAGREVRIDVLDIEVVTDERHSTPTRLLIETDDGTVVGADLPPLVPGPPGTTQRVQVPLAEPIVGRRLFVTVDAATPREVTDWYSDDPVALPVAIAEIRVPGLPERAVSPVLDTGCRDDLVAIDGEPIPVRITGATGDALDGAGLELTTCDDAPITLDVGTHEIRAVPGAETVFDIDRLVLSTPGWDDVAAQPGTTEAPRVEVDRVSATEVTGTVQTDGEPFWLVLDQSMNEGWELDVDDATVDGPRPVDSYAAAWLVTPDAAGTLSVTVSWPPQRVVDVAIVVSALGVLACVAIVAVGALRARRGARSTAVDAEEPSFVWTPGGARAIAVVDRRRLLLAGVITTVLAALVLHPYAAVPAAALVVLAARFPLVGRAAPAVLVAVAGMHALAFQVRDRYPTGGAWPRYFAVSHVAAMLAVLVLAISAVTERRLED